MLLFLKPFIVSVFMVLSTVGHAADFPTSSSLPTYGIDGNVIVSAFESIVAQHRETYDDDKIAEGISAFEFVTALQKNYDHYVVNLLFHERIIHNCAVTYNEFEDAALEGSRALVSDVACEPSNTCCILGIFGACLAAGGVYSPCILCNPKALAIASVKSGSAMPSCLLSCGITLSGVVKCWSGLFGNDEDISVNSPAPVARECCYGQLLTAFLVKQFVVNEGLKERLAQMVQTSHARLSAPLKASFILAGISVNTQEPYRGERARTSSR